MVKKRGLASNRGLDALLGSIKTEKLITGNLIDASVRAAVDDAKSAEKLNAKSTDEWENVSDDESAEASDTIAVAKKSPTSAITPKPFTPKPTKTLKSNTHNAPINNDANDNSNDSSNVAGLNLMHINVAYLQRGKYQPRLDLDEDALQELATSIKQHGVMQPIVIRPLAKVLPNSSITHEIIAGERRWRAAQIAGLTHIPAIMRPMSDDLAIALALIENIQREDLSVMEQAAALQRFHDEFGMSHSQIADVVGKARTTVSNLLRLNQLHDDVKQALNEGQMDMGHARALLALSPKQQPVIAKKIIQGQLTVRETEALVKDILNPKAPTQSQ
ncbi:MAG: ParB/RepB/Spo0J family partition protein, partial [Moraxella osloensis]|nr:ParB/RepB/Spo0J family partition protein [Moraxella osloensis]